MIPLPSPPTDSLYKFVAISGLLLLIAGIVVPPYLETQRNESIYQIQKDVSEINRNNIYQIANILNNDPEMKISHERRVELLKLIGNNTDIFATKNFVYMKEQIEKRNALYEQQMGYLRACIPIGIGLTVIGGLLWWRRVQRYQDRILIAQLKEAENKASPSPQPVPSPAKGKR